MSKIKLQGLLAASLLLVSLASCGTKVASSNSSAQNTTKSELSVLAEGEQEQSLRKQPPAPEEFFGKIDLDEDGAITREEFKAAMDKMPDGAQMVDRFFSEVDANQDGKVTLDEFKSHRPPHGHRDGRPPMGPTMAPPKPEEFFGKIDLDGDGSITREEFKAAMDKIPTPPPPPAGVEAPELPDASQMIDRFFSENDANQDGKVTLDEFKMAPPPPMR